VFVIKISVQTYAFVQFPHRTLQILAKSNACLWL